MKRNFLYTIFLFLLLLMLDQQVSAQSQTTVSATTDKQTILIGGPLVLTLEVNVPQDEAIRFFSIDSIAHFEFLKKGKIDTTDNRKGTRLIQRLKITSFDSGSLVLPRFLLDKSTGLQTDSIPVEVTYTSPFDPQAPYHDVKDVLDQETTKNEKKNYWIYIIAAFVLLLIVILVVILSRKKKPEPLQPAIGAYEKAMQDLQELLQANHDNKQFYTLLIAIFREYLHRRKGIQSLSPSTDELVLQLQEQFLVKEDFLALAQILRLADFVKFAKYQPDETENKMAYEKILQAIQAIEKNTITTT